MSRAMLLVLAVLVGFPLAAVGEEEHAEAKKKAVEAAQSWLKTADEGKYDEAWESAAEYLKKGVKKEALSQSMTAVRTPLGKVVSREAISTLYTTSLPGVPDGAYVVIQFKTTFENKKSAVETITPMLDKDKQWRVSGYFIK